MPQTILVIEDDPEQSKPLIQMLKYRGYKVLPAYNGIDGVAKAMEHLPQLVIVDLLLVQKGDEMDGYAVIQALRETLATSKIGILAWSGHFVDGNDEIRVLRAGADDYVTKDIDFGRLEARIEALLRRINRSDS